MTALPRGIDIGEVVTAPVTPLRTYRRRAVMVTGPVRATSAHSVTLVTPGGYYTVRYADARRVRA